MATIKLPLTQSSSECDSDTGVNGIELQLATANASLAAIEAAELTGLLVWATGTDAAANPDAGAYTAAAACRMRIARCDTNSALVSLDDGVTWLHLALANYSGEQWYAVPAGSKVKAKNAVAGSNFANLSIEIGAV